MVRCSSDNKLQGRSLRGGDAQLCHAIRKHLPNEAQGMFQGTSRNVSLEPTWVDTGLKLGTAGRWWQVTMQHAYLLYVSTTVTSVCIHTEPTTSMFHRMTASDFDSL